MIRPEAQKTITSRTKHFEVRGTAKELVSKYEGLAYQAQREERFSDMHELFQQADHYKRVMTNERV